MTAEEQAGPFDPDSVRSSQLELYGAGEYHAMSAVLRPAADLLVRRAGVQTGQAVLDVGAGDGNISLQVVALGARAVACDISLVQAQRARRRVPSSLAVTADAEHLPFQDRSFDAVLSNFAAVLAPDPERCIAELFRVCRPGGVVGLTAWPPTSLMGELSAAVRGAVADPGSFPDQELHWGDGQVAARRFAPFSRNTRVDIESLAIDPAQRAAAGPDDFAFRYLQPRLAADLSAVRHEIARRHTGSDGRLVAEYLLVSGRRDPD